MPAFLVPVDPGLCLIPLEKAVILIGRQADCDISLTHSRKISRKHCCIAQVNNRFIVRDLGSTNGVFLNGNRIEKEAFISLGDDLVIGDVHFRVQSDPSTPAKKISAKNDKGTTSPSESNPVKSVEPVIPEVASRTPVVPPPIPIVPQLPVAAPPIPVQSEELEAPPSMDIPVAIPEEDLDFDVEPTRARRTPFTRPERVDDVIPLSDDEDEDEDDDKIVRLASDSF